MDEKRPATSAPVVVCERSGGVALVRHSEGGWRRSLLVPAGRWPVWNPRRDILAISVIQPHGDDIRSSIELVDLDGRPIRTLHTSIKGVSPVIAPRVPHYAVWAPAGNVLSYVAQGSYGLSLFLSEADGLFISDPIINGAPIFTAWCPDSNFLAVHAGNELSVVETEGSRATAEVARGAVGFRSPAYSDDGNVLAYAVPAEPGVAVMRALFQGTQGREVRRFPGGVALAFRPGTLHLTVAVTKHPESGNFDEVWLLDLATELAPARLIARGPFVSFFWSPTGDKLALVVPTQTGDGRYAIHALSPEGRFLAATEGIVPSEDYRILLGFFDQYSRSHHLWSPDGCCFLLCGRQPGDAVSSAFGDPAGNYVFIWHVARGAALEIVTAGDIGFFPPRPATPL